MIEVGEDNVDALVLRTEHVLGGDLGVIERNVSSPGARRVAVSECVRVTLISLEPQTVPTVGRERTLS